MVEIGKHFTIEAAEICTALARLFKLRSEEYASYREQDNDIKDMFDNLTRAKGIYELCLGFDHPETADSYTKLALAF